MGWVARRLDGDRTALDAAGQLAFGNKLVEHPVEERGILGVKAQLFVQCWSGRAL